MNVDEDSAGKSVDWGAMRNLTGGDDALLDELIGLFPDESANQLKAISTALEREDGESLTRAAHTLKSSARLFGAGTLADCALDMETLGRSSEFNEARNRLFELEKEVRHVIAALEQGPTG